MQCRCQLDTMKRVCSEAFPPRTGVANDTANGDESSSITTTSCQSSTSPSSSSSSSSAPKGGGKEPDLVNHETSGKKKKKKKKKAKAEVEIDPVTGSHLCARVCDTLKNCGRHRYRTPFCRKL